MRDRPLPLSFAQERLWLLDQLEPGSSAHHLPAAFRLEGPLDTRVLEQAIDSLPEPFRLVFTLRAIEGRSVEEVAASLGINAVTVRTRHHRARQLLQTRLRNEFRTALDGVFHFAGARCENLVARVLSRLPKISPAQLH